MNGISILVATRERPHRLAVFIESLLNTVTDKSKIELLLSIDDDDPRRNEYDSLLETVSDISVHKQIQPFTEFGPYRYNYLVQYAKFEILGMFGDDTKFLTKAWDQEVHEIHGRFTDHICLTYLHETITDRDYIAFHPILHRRHFDLLGYLSPPQFTIYCTDDWLSKMYNFIGRGFRIGSKIEHQHPTWGFPVDDNIYHHRHYPTQTNQMIVRDLQVWKLTQDKFMSDVFKLLVEMKQEYLFPQLQALQNSVCAPAGRCLCSQCIAKHT